MRHTQRKREREIKTETDYREGKGCEEMKGWKNWITAGGKGVEGTFAQGKNGNNKQTTIICFISLPFLYIASSACI